MSEEAGVSGETGRLALPLLEPGQAQKETTHNEALALLDLAAQASVASVGSDDPPADPEPGACWIVGGAPTGDWTGRAGALAGWTAAGWRFLAPFEGMTAWSIADEVAVRFGAGAWLVGEVAAARLLIDGEQVVGARAAAIEGADGGAVIDEEARAAIDSILAAMREHGLIDGS